MARLAKAWLLSPEAAAFLGQSPLGFHAVAGKIFRLRLVLRLYEQRIIGKRECRSSPFWRYKIQYGKGGLRF